MVRARTNRVVMSQRDVRQTTQPQPSQPAASQPRSAIFCTWCRSNGRHFACLTESSQFPSQGCADSASAPIDDWSSWSVSGESWVPASGPCCQDCLDAAFERQKKMESEQRGKLFLEEVHCWCQERYKQMVLILQQGWKVFRDRLEGARQQWTPRKHATKMAVWQDVALEAEGFLEVKLVVSRQGATQHMEVDFPTDVPVATLQYELATLIDVPAEAQVWYHLAMRMDETKTLEQLNVDIGAILEVKCQN